MVPSVGRIVHYRLSAADVVAIERKRASGLDGGNPVSEGDIYPMIITRVCGEGADVSGRTAVQGQVFLDGPDTLWVTSRQQGPADGQWSEPGRVY